MVLPRPLHDAVPALILVATLVTAASHPVTATATRSGANAGQVNGPDAAAAMPARERQTIAVSPFTNATGEPSDDWMGTGIAESIIADLLANGFRVVNLEPPVMRLTPDDHGADFLVTGEYQRVEDRLRLTSRLLDPQGQTVVASAVANGSFTQLFALEDEIAEHLIASLTTGRDDETRSTDRTDAARPPAVAVSRPTTTGGTLGVSAAPGLAPGAPPPPEPPDVIRRSSSGQATLRAVRIEQALSVDGSLDEDVYRQTPAISGFVQIEPRAGQPATEKTEAWIFFDNQFFYVSARAWDSAAESRWVANEMRRDSFNVPQNENIGFALDTYYDRRNSVIFIITPLGGRLDAQITNERDFNVDWNPIWDLKTGRFEGGWTVEARIPFRSLRYRPGRSQVWGIQMRRDVRWKNEMDFLVPLDPGLGQRGLIQASQAATLVGLEVPPLRSPIEIKPYVIGDVSSNLTATPVVSNALGGNAGIDVIKYGVTQNLTADFTANTDFAQVEADEQQVNLTRFSLFFPEKREFFLENQGAFQFGTGGGRGPISASPEAPIVFYSRRIGLSGGLEVPIVAGGRLTGRVGPFTIGALNIQTDSDPDADARSTNFTVMRVKRDILRRSSVGAIFTNRSVSVASPVDGSNQAYGLDAAMAFYDNLLINTYWARTKTTGITGHDASYSGDLRYNGDRYGVTAEHLFIDRNFSPEVGFLRRDNMRKSFGSLRFSPRPRSIEAIRKLTWEGSYNYITDAGGFVETRELIGLFESEMENSDRFILSHTRTYDFLPDPFEIAEGIVLPVGGYDFANTQIGYTFGSQRRLAGRLAFERGSFYGGTKTTITVGGSGRGSFGGGRIEISPQLSVEPGMSLNWVDLPQGDFTTTLASARVTYTVTPLMFVSALMQYNSSLHALSSNIRLRWEYQPGSELFIVYNEQRDTLAPTHYPELQQRAFIVKLNRLFRF